jgi:hypothetical protein
MLGRPEQFVFGRTRELDELGARVRERRTFLFCGEAGTGKSLLAASMARDFPNLIYCQAHGSMSDVSRQLVVSLWDKENATIRSKLGRKPGEKLKNITSVSLRGLIVSALKEHPYYLVLDHLGFVSQQFASMLKSWLGGSTPLLCIARSGHMEQIGYASALFPDRKDKLLLANFDAVTAAWFFDWRIRESSFQAANLDHFKLQVLHFSRGNPGAISRMIQMAILPKYRSGDQVKMTPLYVDFRLAQNTAAVK